MMLLLRFRFPQKFIDYLQPFSIVSLDFSYSYHIPGIEWLSQKFSIKSLGNLELGKIEMKDDSFLANYLSTIIFVVLLLFLHTIVYSIYMWNKSSIDSKENGCMKKVRNKIGHFFCYNVYVELMLEASALVNLVAVYNIVYYDFSSYWVIASFASAIIWVIIYLIFLCQILYRTCKYKSEDEMNGRFRTLYNGFDYFKPRARYYYIIFLSRRAMMIGIILGIHNPYIQASWFVFCQLLNMIYLLTTFPYKLLVDNINCIIIELGYLANWVLIFFLPTLDNGKDSDSKISDQGFIMMVIVMGSSNLAILFSLTNSIVVWIKDWKFKWKNGKVASINSWNTSNLTIHDNKSIIAEEIKSHIRKTDDIKDQQNSIVYNRYVRLVFSKSVLSKRIKSIFRN